MSTPNVNKWRRLEIFSTGRYNSVVKNLIIIPTYNECGNISRLIPQIFSAAPEAHILVVDDSSPDGTAAAVRELMPLHPHLSLIVRPQKIGLGAAYIDTIVKVLAEDQANEINSITTMDADLSHPAAALKVFFEKLENGYDVAIGSRYIPSGAVHGWELWRKLLSHLGNIYCRLITKMPIKDCTSGFQCVAAPLLRKIDFSKCELSGYAFQMFLKFALLKLGARVAEVPIVFKNREEGESKISLAIINEGLLLPWRLVRK
ncbi:MAG: glycosyl transferase, group 2 family protein [Candidatus Magasanikbacteria bacterium]|nr:glycosyl transferase, group 2 family protein [Candidatus Magasanikbacteria bacterium]